MSINLVDQVWTYSQRKGSELLLLLALADESSNEEGWIVASVPRLAQKTRLSPRNVQRLLTRLVQTGELVEGVENVYRIRTLPHR